MSATATELRIGEVARRVGTTPRTIRYYEEIGLLPAGGERQAGRHRLYGERDVQRLRDALRLKELLGVSLDELKELLEAQEARAALRDEWRHGEPGTDRKREMLAESARLIHRQLELVRRRRDEIAALEDELVAKRREVLRKRRELSED
jgi:MerR family transcriptional regulator, repressor of the yfmOP operon